MGCAGSKTQATAPSQANGLPNLMSGNPQDAEPAATKPVAGTDPASVVDVAVPIKPRFSVGDRVRCAEDGKEGTVVKVYDDDDPKVVIDGEEEPRQRFGLWFSVISNATPSPEESVVTQKPVEDKASLETTNPVQDEAEMVGLSGATLAKPAPPACVDEEFGVVAVVDAETEQDNAQVTSCCGWS